MLLKSLLAIGLLVIGGAKAIVNVKGEWKENYGWEVTCSWQTLINDTLQSVTLHRNDHQYAVFRPEVNGRSLLEEIPAPGFLMRIDCRVSSGGQRGRCVTSMNLHQPASEDLYACEVSGERPTFLQERGEFHAFVAPSNAAVRVNMEEDTEVFNCSSTGVPPPKLVWTADGTQIPEDFTTTQWDSRTKLWHSWSTYRPHGASTIACSAEVTTRTGQIVRGLTSVTSDVGRMGTKTTSTLILGLLLLRLLRW